ncbi:hypothetical protein M6B38_106175 [Iris pallida]|uniref:Uncharacterized protein n=1 Tax=Iris pallida TaxID=29817 RepID=A0AAX6ES55_IRIPA|nr:hypothetical protein M6B38_106175 [Iris pallida]
MLGKMTYPQISVREMVLVELLQFTREQKEMGLAVHTMVALSLIPFLLSRTFELQINAASTTMDNMRGISMYSELASRQSSEFYLKENSAFLDAVKIFGDQVARGDKPVSMYDLVQGAGVDAGCLDGNTSQ